MLQGDIALVTGSTRGTGAAIADTFARHGAKVVVHGRRIETANAVAADIRRAGGHALAVAGDVTRSEDLEAMRTQIERELGPVDILVANAGGNPTPPCPLEEIDEAAWHQAIDGNLTACFLTIRCFLPGMKQRRRGNIIAVSSSAARTAHPMAPIPYAVAKTGIEMLTRALSTQAGPSGIRVNAIAPGTILTERNKQNIPEPLRVKLAERHPLRRLGHPDDVAGAALYLATDQSAWTTGTVLDVAGGGLMA
jgi:Dehydrogenases with different specificities (related to short-chain alcohol dehydrogenases)